MHTLQSYYKREGARLEKERILGTLEYFRDELGKEKQTAFTKRYLDKVIHTIEWKVNEGGGRIE